MTSTLSSCRHRLQVFGVGLLMAVGSNIAAADTIYNVRVDTSSLTGTSAILAFDLIAGGGAQDNNLSITNFSTDGALASIGPNSGSVTGSIPGSTQLSTSSGTSFFNEYLQGLTLGASLSFQLDATTNAPSRGTVPDTFSFFILDSTASYSLLATTDPTGADSLFTLQIDGTSPGLLAVYNSSPDVPVTASPVPLPQGLSLLASALGMVALTCAIVRKRIRHAAYA